MSLGSFLGSPFGTGNYDVTQGLPGYVPGSFLPMLQQSQYNSQIGIGQQQNFLNALQAGGFGSGLNQNQFAVLKGQQALSEQYGQMAKGQGPNLGQTQLAEATGQNIQQQAALMAGARGAQSNAGLIGRQAAQIGGNLQQQAVGQSAVLRAQQQMSALQQQAAMQSQMANLTTAGVGQQQTALSQLGNQNLSYQQMLQNALTAQNQQQVQAQIGQSYLAGLGMTNSANIIGGALNGLGAVGAMGAAGAGGAAGGVGSGGESGQGGPTESSSPAAPAPANTAGATSYGGAPNLPTPAQAAANPAAYEWKGGVIPKKFDAGGQVDTPTSIQRQDASQLPQNQRSILGQFANGDSTDSSMPKMPSPQSDSGNGIGGFGTLAGLAMLAMASKGGKVEGKPNVFGDSEKNDVVPAKLSPGEIVIKRTASKSPEKAAEFLNNLMGWNLRAA